MNHEELLRELCLEESDTVYSGVLKRRSVLMQLKNDIAFNQSAPRLPNAPRALLAAPLLFCTAVDLVIRIKYKADPPHRKNGDYFQKSAREYFGFSVDHAEKLWGLRNSLSHQYSGFNYTIISVDGRDIISPGTRGGLVINIAPMEATLVLACQKLHEHLSDEDAESQHATRQFILQHCHVYYHI